MSAKIDSYEVFHRCGVIKKNKRKLQRSLIKFLSPMPQQLESEIVPIFVVGCGHSGTTLLASMLFQHPDILPIPKETNAFNPSRGLCNSLTMIEQWSAIASALQIKAFVEKTPKHVHCIDEILKFIPQAKIIFISRDAVSCIESMYKRFSNLEFCIERYCIDNEAGIQAINTGLVKHVRLEDILLDKEKYVSEVLDYCKLSFSKKTLSVTENFYERAAGSGLLPYRIKQMSNDIEEKKTTVYSMISSGEKSLISRQTAHIAEQLGY